MLGWKPQCPKSGPRNLFFSDTKRILKLYSTAKDDIFDIARIKGGKKKWWRILQNSLRSRQNGCHFADSTLKSGLMFEKCSFWFKFQWSLCARVWFIISQLWLRYGLVAQQATSYYLGQCMMHWRTCRPPWSNTLGPGRGLIQYSQKFVPWGSIYQIHYRFNYGLAPIIWQVFIWNLNVMNPFVRHHHRFR